jgi:rSAM/selenodomain-associated transferase 1
MRALESALTIRADLCALAVMAKVPVPGLVKTRLCPPLTPGQAAALARCLLLDTLAKVRQTPGAAPCLVYAPAGARGAFRDLAGDDIALLPQEGRDLGERMHRLSSRLLAAGCAAVVILGTDSPTLPAAVLADAVAHVRRGKDDLILGPSEDGGYYLIGLSRPQPDLFAGVAWGGSGVLADTRERARRRGLRVRLLPRWWDVDTPADLARLREELRRTGSDTAPRTAAYLRTLAG